MFRFEVIDDGFQVRVEEFFVPLDSREGIEEIGPLTIDSSDPEAASLKRASK
jgi:hypothetical protein